MTKIRIKYQCPFCLNTQEFIQPDGMTRLQFRTSTPNVIACWKTNCPYFMIQVKNYWGEEHKYMIIKLKWNDGTEIGAVNILDEFLELTMTKGPLKFLPVFGDNDVEIILSDVDIKDVTKYENSAVPEFWRNES